MEEITQLSKTYKLFQEINQHLLKDEKPSLFLAAAIEKDAFQNHPFSMIHQLRYTEQSPVHHPEGNAWNHTLLVVDYAAGQKYKSKEPRAFMWAALLHDIGKPSTTRNRKGKITSYNHDKEGAKLCKTFLSYFNENDDFIKKVSALVLYHMQILFVVNNLPFKQIREMKRDTDIKEVALLGYCDRMGRTNANQEKIEREVEEFCKKCF